VNPRHQPPDREAFALDGFTVVREIVTAHEVAALRTIIDDFIVTGIEPTRQVLYTHAEPAESRPAMTRIMHQWLNPHRRVPETLVSALSAARSLASAILGEPPVLFQDVLLDKRAGHAAFPWHQDMPYWPVDRQDGIIVWVALDPVDAAAGGVHVLRHSHQQGEGPPIDLHTGSPQSGGQPIECPMDGEILCPILAPGDALVFHTLTWHCSPPRDSAGSRRAWASSWLSRGTRWNIGRAPRHPLASLVADGSEVTEWRR